MKRFAAAGLLSLALLAPAGAAHAGPTTDALSRCLVQSASSDDRVDMVLWMFSAMSLHPDVKQYSRFTDADRARINQSMGALMTRLLVEDCRAQTVAALRADGKPAIETAFGVLGEQAGEGLMSNPAVSRGISAMAETADLEALGKVMKEAGVY